MVSASQPVSQSAPPPLSRSAAQPLSRSAAQLLSRPAAKPLSRSAAWLWVTVGLVLSTLSPLASALYRDGYEVVETGPGGFFGAIVAEDSGTAWFAVDDQPTRLVRLDLESMTITGKLELRHDEERVWTLVRRGKYGFIGVEKPAGRLVGVDLDKMTRMGYATASQFPLLAGVTLGDFGYFSAGSNPATVMRLHLDSIQEGKCANWDSCRFEVVLKPGEEAARTMFSDPEGAFLYIGLYSEPGRIVKMELPSLKRIKDLHLPQGMNKVLCGSFFRTTLDPTDTTPYGIFGLATSPGQIVKVNLETMRIDKTLHCIDGEDRPATIVVHGRHGYVGFGSAWAEGTSSILKVDLERMVRTAAIITREGQTWLYTGIGYKDWVFFGTRGTATTKHATVLRINTNPTYPGVPVPPNFNQSGSSWIELNWLRDYPEYHNGGAPVIGARVLVRPSDHHDWTGEHVYAYAAPDPAAPKDRIIRVHEAPKELMEHGYVAKVDELQAETGYKFAIILTNEVGPSHRSRSSYEMRTALSEMIEGLWVSLALGATFFLLSVYGLAWAGAPRIDALYVDNESEEEAGNSLLRTAPKAGAAVPVTIRPGTAGLENSGTRPEGSGLRRVAHKVASSVSAFGTEDGAGRTMLMALLSFSFLSVVAAAFQFFFTQYVGTTEPYIPGEGKYIYAFIAILSTGGATWCISTGMAAWQARESDHARRALVAGGVVVWGTMVTSMVTIMAMTQAKLSPDTALAAQTVTWLVLLASIVGVLVEGIVLLLRRHPQPAETVTLPVTGLSNWITERL